MEKKHLQETKEPMCYKTIQLVTRKTRERRAEPSGVESRHDFWVLSSLTLLDVVCALVFPSGDFGGGCTSDRSSAP